MTIKQHSNASELMSINDIASYLTDVAPSSEFNLGEEECQLVLDEISEQTTLAATLLGGVEPAVTSSSTSNKRTFPGEQIENQLNKKLRKSKDKVDDISPSDIAVYPYKKGMEKEMINLQMDNYPDHFIMNKASFVKLNSDGISMYDFSEFCGIFRHAHEVSRYNIVVSSSYVPDIKKFESLLSIFSLDCSFNVKTKKYHFQIADLLKSEFILSVDLMTRYYLIARYELKLGFNLRKSSIDALRMHLLGLNKDCKWKGYSNYYKLGTLASNNIGLSDVPQNVLRAFASCSPIVNLSFCEGAVSEAWKHNLDIIDDNIKLLITELLNNNIESLNLSDPLSESTTSMPTSSIDSVSVTPVDNAIVSHHPLQHHFIEMINAVNLSPKIELDLNLRNIPIPAYKLVCLMLRDAYNHTSTSFSFYTTNQYVIASNGTDTFKAICDYLKLNITLTTDYLNLDLNAEAISSESAMLALYDKLDVVTQAILYAVQTYDAGVCQAEIEKSQPVVPDIQLQGYEMNFYMAGYLSARNVTGEWFLMNPEYVHKMTHSPLVLVVDVNYPITNYYLLTRDQIIAKVNCKMMHGNDEPLSLYDVEQQPQNDDVSHSGVQQFGLFAQLPDVILELQPLNDEDVTQTFHYDFNR